MLAALSAGKYARLLPDLKLVLMPLGYVLYESDVQMRHVYFPITSIASLSVTGRSGLEARACECYAVVRKEFDRLFPETIAH